MQHQQDQQAIAGSSNNNYDDEFQRGLEAILRPMRESGASQEQLEQVALRAQEFYARRRSQGQTDSQSTSSASVPQRAESSTGKSQTATETSASERTEGGATPVAPTDPTQVHAPTVSPVDSAPYPVSFEEIAEMIANGTPIPGIKEIPTVINEQQPSEAKIARVEGAGKKPWEK